MIRRPPRSTLDRSSAASDVYKRQLHNADQPPQQILITAATGVKIGEAGNGNVLSDAINGIVAERSNVEVYSNTFSNFRYQMQGLGAVSYTHLRAHETVLDLVCRLLLEKKKNKK